MKTSWTIAVAVSLCAGAAVAACGSSGSKASGSAGQGGSGTMGTAGTATGGAGHGGSMSGTTTGGLVFDGGLPDSSAHDGDACGSMGLITHATPGNLVVVFDQSDSMSQAYTETDGGTAGVKYKVAEQALVAALTPYEAQVNAGAIFFPTTATGNTCSTVALIGTPPQIPIEPGAMFVTDFQGHFSAKGWTLILGTPLKDALSNTDLALPDPSPFPGKRAVVILTDGAPTCDTVTADILAPVQDMFSRGIKTYAVGLPGSSAASTLLNAIASAGGTTSYLSPADPTALQTALAGIASDTIDQCTITLSPPPPDPSLVYLIVTDAAHPQGEDIPRSLDGGDGWTLSADGTTATLEGAVCTTAKDGGYTSIQFVYGCDVLP